MLLLDWVAGIARAKDFGGWPMQLLHATARRRRVRYRVRTGGFKVAASRKKTEPLKGSVTNEFPKSSSIRWRETL